MNNFKQGNRSGGRKDFGKGRSFSKHNSGRRDSNRRDSERPEMFKAVCAECGNKCEVPFRPTDGRPVLCSDCFGNHNDRGREQRRPERSMSDRAGNSERSFGFDRQMYSAVCGECGQRCEVPFKPSGDRPVLCSNCFEGSKKPAGTNGRINLSEEQFEILNNKLDKLLEILKPVSSEEPVSHDLPIKAMKTDEKKKPAKKTDEEKTSRVKPALKKTVAKRKK